MNLPPPFQIVSTVADFAGDGHTTPSKHFGIRWRQHDLASYGDDELHARIATLVHKVPTLGFRFFNVYGPRQDPNSPYSGVISKFIDKISTGQPIEIYGDGEQTRDFIYVDDVVSSLIKGMSHQYKNGDVFNVCTGENTSVNRLAEILQSVFKTKVEKQFFEARKGDIRKSLGDPSNLREALIVSKPELIEQGLKKLCSLKQPSDI